MRIPIILIVSLLLASPAHALGKLGHRVVGELAQGQLDAGAQSAVADLLIGEPEPSLAGIAVWADELRGTDPVLGKRSAPWHYLNFPRPSTPGSHDNCRYQPERDCRNGDCVVGAIERQLRVLADRSQPKPLRLRALKFVVHFVGDVHQPLHAGYGADKGGNAVQLRYAGQGTNLHGVWDYWLLNTSGHADSRSYAEALRGQPPLPSDDTALLANPAARWAEESCRIVGTEGFYPNTRKLSQAYLDRQRPILETRLRQAGARLARLLNTALAAQPN